MGKVEKLIVGGGGFEWRVEVGEGELRSREWTEMEK